MFKVMAFWFRFLFIIGSGLLPVQGKLPVFSQTWVKMSVFRNFDSNKPLYTPTVYINPRFSPKFSLKSRDRASVGLVNVDPGTGSLYIRPEAWSHSQKGVKKIGFQLCIAVFPHNASLGMKLKPVTRVCQGVTVKMFFTDLKCSLDLLNKQNMIEAVTYGGYDFVSCRTCKLSANYSEMRIGQLLSPVLQNICPNIHVSCSIYPENLVLSHDHYLVDRSTANHNLYNFDLNCTAADPDGESIRFQKIGKLETIEVQHLMPKPQMKDHLTFYPNDFFEEGSKVLLSMVLEAPNTAKYRYDVDCGFITKIETGSQYQISCSRTEYSNLTVCDGNPEASPFVLAISLTVAKVELDKLLDEQNTAVCQLTIVNSMLEFSSCSFEAAYNLTFHTPHTEPLHISPVEPRGQPEAGETRLYLQRGWRPLARLGNLNTETEELHLCGTLNQSLPNYVSYTDGILYVSSNLPENPPDLCVQTNSSAPVHIQSTVGEEDETECDASDWCSVHTLRSTCTSACHAVTRERCIWVESRDQGRGYPFSTCVANQWCGDGQCDALEQRHISICPQDCADFTDGMQLFGTGFPGLTGRGILGAKSVNSSCTCSHHSCQCAHNSFSEIPQLPVKPSKKVQTWNCDSDCVLLLSLAVFITVSTSTAVFVYHFYRRFSLTQRSKYIESVSSMPLSDYADDSRSTTSTLFTNTTASSVFHAPAQFVIDKKYEFPRINIILDEVLGEGEFGKVMSARALNFRGKSGYTRVAIKMLKNHYSSSEFQDLISEYNLLKEVDHPHVIKLLGACTDRRGPLYIIIEYAKHGSLRSFLRTSRERLRDRDNKHTSKRPQRTISSENPSISAEYSSQSEETVYDLTITDLISFAWQVSKGMSYLSDIKLVHRDLAARNVLVAEGKMCKISDFGLSRDVYTDEAYWKKTSGKLPIKWMAPESLRDHVYTSRSDVWGFGILLWELVTLGSSPYPGVQPDRLFPLLSAGYRMQRPAGCPHKLYEMMLDCWAQNSDKRPSFATIEYRLEKLLQSTACYLDVEADTVHNRGYMNTQPVAGCANGGLNYQQRVEGVEQDKEGYLKPISIQSGYLPMDCPGPTNKSGEEVDPLLHNKQTENLLYNYTQSNTQGLPDGQTFTDLLYKDIDHVCSNPTGDAYLALAENYGKTQENSSCNQDGYGGISTNVLESSLDCQEDDTNEKEAGDDSQTDVIAAAEDNHAISSHSNKIMVGSYRYIAGSEDGHPSSAMSGSGTFHPYSSMTGSGTSHPNNTMTASGTSHSYSPMSESGTSHPNNIMPGTGSCHLNNVMTESGSCHPNNGLTESGRCHLDNTTSGSSSCNLTMSGSSSCHPIRSGSSSCHPASDSVSRPYRSTTPDDRQRGDKIIEIKDNLLCPLHLEINRKI